LPVGGRSCQNGERSGIAKVLPERRRANDVSEGMARDMIRNGLLLHEVKHALTAEHLKVLVLQMLDIATGVDLADKIVIVRANK
jgi:hypothetical protein